MKIGINGAEWLIIAGCVVFGIVWIILLLPIVISSTWFLGLPAPIQYLCFNIGFMLLITTLLGTPISLVKSKKLSFLSILKSGLASWIVVSFVFDLWSPPYVIDYSGNTIITIADTLITVTPDKTVCWLWTAVGIPSFLLFYFTYLLTPIIAIVISALILTPNTLAKAASLR